MRKISGLSPIILIFEYAINKNQLDYFYHIGLVLLLIVIVFTPMFGMYYLIKLVWNVFVESSSKNYFGKIDFKYMEHVLSAKCQYYQKLSEPEKSRFLKRVNNFITNKEFIPAGGHELTEDMIVLISACAIQLTFGLDEYLFFSFPKIIVYPKEYYSKKDHQYHKGEANLAGAIVLSWNNFLDGYSKSSDNYNLGLHEMAHALRFDKFKSDDYDEFFVSYFEKWQMIAKDEFLKLKNHHPSFLRAYGGTNIHEFFSVCVEYFFESPKEFKLALPELYNHLCILLNQDPLTNTVVKGSMEEYSRQGGHLFKLEGPLIYESIISVKNSLALLIAIGFWVLLLKNVFTENENELFVFFSILLPVIGYFVSAIEFKKIFFYSNGIKIKYFVPAFFERPTIFSYEQLIAVTLKEGNAGTNDSLEISYLFRGKIKSTTFITDLLNNQVIKIADMLVEKKVAVKIVGNT